MALFLFKQPLNNESAASQNYVSIPKGEDPAIDLCIASVTSASPAEIKHCRLASLYVTDIGKERTFSLAIFYINVTLTSLDRSFVRGPWSCLTIIY